MPWKVSLLAQALLASTSLGLGVFIEKSSKKTLALIAEFPYSCINDCFWTTAIRKFCIMFFLVSEIRYCVVCVFFFKKKQQLKKTTEELNDALATKEEIAQRCHELDMQVAVHFAIRLKCELIIGC